MGTVKLAFDRRSAARASQEAKQLRIEVLKNVYDNSGAGAGAFSNSSWEGKNAKWPSSKYAQRTVSRKVSGKEDRGLVVVDTAPPQRNTSDNATEPWCLKRVVTGHEGWVQCIDVDVGNEWFITGSADTTVKVWDLATGNLKLTLTGHKLGVRAVVLSEQMPYFFSAGADKSVRCWDLEYNKVIRDYHGHLGAVNTLSLHPRLNVLASAGQDKSIRVWDIRTRNAVQVLLAHQASINTLACQDSNPQIISGSSDRTIKLWDIAAGRSMTTLTHHSNSVRSLVVHPHESTFASAAKDSVKQWQLPQGKLIGNLMERADSMCMALYGEKDSLVLGDNNGTLTWIDWKSGYTQCRLKSPPIPGSLDSERAVLCCKYDHSGARLITGDMDKSIKLYASTCV